MNENRSSVDIDRDGDIITINSQVTVPSHRETVEVSDKRELDAPAPPATDSPPATQPVQAHNTEDDDTIHVERHEEELQATKTMRDSGEVRVSKDVVEEELSIDVPVSREEVSVRSVTPSNTAVDPSQAFRDDTISVPVSEEHAEVRKEARLVEEIEIDKTAVQQTERVTDTVRKEELHVQELGNVEVDVRSEEPLDETVSAKD